MDSPFKMIKVDSLKNINELNETCMMCSLRDPRPNITKSDLIHLINGKPLVDASDGENVHMIELNTDALIFIRKIISKSLK